MHTIFVYPIELYYLPAISGAINIRLLHILLRTLTRDIIVDIKTMMKGIYNCVYTYAHSNNIHRPQL